MKYEVRVCEKQYVYITVDADSMADAKLAAHKKYIANDYTIDARCTKSVSYETLYPNRNRPLGRSR